MLVPVFWHTGPSGTLYTIVVQPLNRTEREVFIFARYERVARFVIDLADATRNRRLNLLTLPCYYGILSTTDQVDVLWGAMCAASRVRFDEPEALFTVLGAHDWDVQDFDLTQGATLS